jgi:hypothetical protein
MPSKQKIPKRFRHLVNELEYERIMDLAVAALPAGVQVQRVQDGAIYVRSDGPHPAMFGLDNLIRVCALADPGTWPDLIREHFRKLEFNKGAFAYLLKDFDYARQFLRLSVKHATFAPPEELDALIRRQDLPDTYTLPVLDFEDKFHYLRKDGVHEWETPEDEIFEAATENLAQEDVQVMEGLLGEEHPVFSVISSNYSAAFILDLARNLPHAIGAYGAVTAIPSRSFALVYPIHDESIAGSAEVLQALTARIYREQPGPIAGRLYWYFDGAFELFPSEPGRPVALPEGLRNLLD